MDGSFYDALQVKELRLERGVREGLSGDMKKCSVMVIGADGQEGVITEDRESGLRKWYKRRKEMRIYRGWRVIYDSRDGNIG